MALTEQDIKPVPRFEGEAHISELNALADALYAAQAVIVRQERRLTELEQAAKPAARKTTATKATAAK